ncbi:MAG: SufD family Fe-S cluster assembly protein [Minisyncoccota bacterium]
MRFKDISKDTITHYTLTDNERCVFFLLNRSDALTLELTSAGSQVYIFAFFIGQNTDTFSLTINQRHLAPHTISHTLIKSILTDTATLTYDGLIHIGKSAMQSNASQESRAILLSSDAKVSAEPTLEILANDVVCRHSAVTAPLNQESLFFARSRGLSENQAITLLINGFFNEALEKIRALGIDTAPLTIRLTDQMKNVC